jgi:two-component system, NtrC family, response regulator AtoC
VKPSRILLIDADATAAESLREVLGGAAAVEHVSSLQQGLERVGAGGWSATILSLDLANVDAQLLRRLREHGGETGALLVTSASPTMQMMLEVSQLGVLALLPAPLDAAAAAEALAEVVAPRGEVVPLPQIREEGPAEEVAIGASPAMLEVFQTVGRVARSTATVLILGESGTGKELVARAIHRNSDRAAGPFIAINCAAVPENLLESELFGHEKGAFTGAIARKIGRFQRADGGTLLLDEIGDMSLTLQSKILRALQEREIERVGGEERIPIDVRVVAATNKDLRGAISAGSFREDLYFRLAVVTIPLPRLAARGNDLELLARYWVARLADAYGRHIEGISRSVLEILRAHSWPGNVRELRNVLERAVLLSSGPVLLPAHLPPLDADTPEEARPVRPPLIGYSTDLTLAEVERLHIEAVLERVGGHMGRAAEILGLHRNTLTRKVQELGLRRGG